MADKRISDLNALTATASDDVALVSDTSASETKKITLANVFNKVPTWIGFADTVATVAADVLVIPVTASIVHKTAGGDAETLSIVAGTQGQILIIVKIAGAGTATISDSDIQGTVAFNSIGDTAVLLFTNSLWYFIGGNATSSLDS